MSPDVNLKSYYLQYINNAQSDIIKYKQGLEDTIKIKEKLYEYLDNNRSILYDEYNLHLVSHTKEWIEKVYNSAELLYNKSIKLINNVKEDVNRIILIQLVKYCNLLRVENKYNQLIILANNRKTIKFSVYSKYVTNYYSKVHKAVLEGLGYRYSGGIGTYCINHWKIDPKKASKNKRIDFAATNARKKEILDAGGKLYDEKLALWYANRKIPYDGIDFRVYKNESSFYDFTFIKSDIFTNKSLDYKRTEYVNARYRDLSYTGMADKLCKTLDDVYNLQVDIKYKLNILLYKNPNIYLNFIRNADQCKYKRGAHNS